MTGSTPSGTPHGDAVSLAVALDRAAAEAALWAAALTRLEMRVSNGLALNLDLGGTMQDVDLIRQGVEGLGTFLEALAKTASPDLCAPVALATERLGLQAQARRLSGGAGAPAVAVPAAPELWQD